MQEGGENDDQIAQSMKRRQWNMHRCEIARKRSKTWAIDIIISRCEQENV